MTETTPVPPPLAPGYRHNFETLTRAFANGDAALVSCLTRDGLKPVAVICAVHRDDGDYVVTPLAKLFDGDPYEELLPPIPEKADG